MSTPEPHCTDAPSDPQAELTLDQLCRCCAVQTEFVMTLLEEGMVLPIEGHTPDSWRFGATQVRHITVAWRLQRDLGVNPAGAAVAMQLLDEMESLRAQLAVHHAGQATLPATGQG